MNESNEGRFKAGWEPTRYLRFVKRDGKMILQQRWEQEMILMDDMWLDVPVEDENPVIANYVEEARDIEYKPEDMR